MYRSLKQYVAQNSPNYGSDANSILEMLFIYYLAYRFWFDFAYFGWYDKYTFREERSNHAFF